MIVNFEEIDFDQARDIKQALESLLESQGWEIVRQFLVTRNEARMRSLSENVPETIEQMSRFNRLRGQVEGEMAVMGYVQQLLSDVTEELRRKQDELQAELELEQGDEYNG